MRNILRMILCILMAVCLCGCAEKKKDEAITCRFADHDEGAKLLLSNTEYYGSLTQNDINYRLQKTDGTLEELKEYASKQVMDFSDAEKDVITQYLGELEAVIEERGYHLPDAGEIVFVKTTGLEEGMPAAYTHGTQIYFTYGLLQAITGSPYANPSSMRYYLAHELFHCLTRSDKEFRAAMYDIIHFKTEKEDYVFPEEISEQIMANPDVEHHNSHAEFTINGEKRECAVICTVPPFEKKGDNVFSVMETKLVPVDTLSEMYDSRDVPDFNDVFGMNTDYVIDPEETMADNFAFTLVYWPERSYLTPDIMEKIDAYLKKQTAKADFLWDTVCPSLQIRPFAHFVTCISIS